MDFLSSCFRILCVCVLIVPGIILISFIVTFVITVIILEEITLIFVVPIKFKKFYIPFTKKAFQTYMAVIKEMIQPSKS